MEGSTGKITLITETNWKNRELNNSILLITTFSTLSLFIWTFTQLRQYFPRMFSLWRVPHIILHLGREGLNKDKNQQYNFVYASNFEGGVLNTP